MRTIGALAAGAALLLTACATVPPYRDDAVSTAEIVRHIKCELREAVWSGPANNWLRPWNAALVLSLEVFHNGEIAGDTGVVFPVNQSGTFVPGLVAGYSGQATRTERISFNESLQALHGDKTLGCEGRDTSRYGRLGGRLGFADLFERAGRTRKIANLTGLTQLDYNLDFIVKSNAGIEPRFALVPVGHSRSAGGGIKLAGSNSDTQTLKLTLIPPAHPPAGMPMTRGLTPEPRSGGIGAADEERLERSKSRNLLESIDDKLRRQNIGN